MASLGPQGQGHPSTPEMWPQGCGGWLPRWCHSLQGKEEMEAEDANTPAPTGPSEATLRAAQFELYNKDSLEVKEVHVRILGLEEEEAATQENFDSSPDFQLRWATDETRQPKVISKHWIDYLDRQGHLAECKPRD